MKKASVMPGAEGSGRARLPDAEDNPRKVRGMKRPAGQPFMASWDGAVSMRHRIVAERPRRRRSRPGFATCTLPSERLKE